MKKIMLIPVMALIGMLIVGPVAAAESENIHGTWEYQVPSAPYEYSKGQLIIEETDGELTLTVKFIDGTQIKGEQVKFEDNLLSFGVHLDTDFIKVSCKIENDKLSGQVDSPEGPADLFASREK